MRKREGETEPFDSNTQSLMGKTRSQTQKLYPQIVAETTDLNLGSETVNNTTNQYPLIAVANPHFGVNTDNARILYSSTALGMLMN